jgi:membrane-bound lytic murein transglycosylase MltF
MSAVTDSSGSEILVSMAVLSLLILGACGKERTTPQATAGHPKEPRSAQARVGAAPKSSPEEPPPPSSTLVLPLNFEHHTDDLDAMVKRRYIRALFVINPIGFFYDRGLPRGIIYEGLEEFQKFTNKALKTGTLAVKVTFVPVRLDQLEAALNEGMGDLIASGVVVTPERERRVAFSVPLQTNVTQIIVTGPEYASVSSLEDLGGKQVWVNPLTTYYENLQKVNDSLEKDGKAGIDIKQADKILDHDDLIQMVNAGLIPATVTTKQRAELWSKVFPNLKPHPEMVIATDGQLAWAMRKSNPQLKKLVDRFVGTHAVGTSFGSTLVRRYLQNTKWITNSTSKQEMEKFRRTVAIFQKYATQYGFDYLMLGAQGYQESMLNQERRSPRGAVGIMQVMPKYAAAPPINIRNVGNADGNVHAAVKMLRNIGDTYFNDQNVDPVNKTLLVFASYNAGPSRIARLRKQATNMGLNPNVWFDNVELVAAKDIGQETVTYVRNIYKYYIAYKLALEEAQHRQKVKRAAA